jgi:hypothetical protein
VRAKWHSFSTAAQSVTNLHGFDVVANPTPLNVPGVLFDDHPEDTYTDCDNRQKL